MTSKRMSRSKPRARRTPQRGKPQFTQRKAPPGWRINPSSRRRRTPERDLPVHLKRDLSEFQGLVGADIKRMVGDDLGMAALPGPNEIDLLIAKVDRGDDLSKDELDSLFLLLAALDSEFAGEFMRGMEEGCGSEAIEEGGEAGCGISPFDDEDGEMLEESSEDDASLAQLRERLGDDLEKIGMEAKELMEFVMSKMAPDEVPFVEQPHFPIDMDEIDSLTRDGKPKDGE